MMQQSRHITDKISRQVFAGAISERLEEDEYKTGSQQFNAMSISSECLNNLLYQAFVAAIARGEWSGEIDYKAVEDANYGLVFERVVVRAIPLDESTANKFAKAIVAVADTH